jgi:hypothetical protein
MAFQGLLSKHDIDILIKASDETDASKNQTRANDRKHYMRQPGQSREAARVDAEKFIDEQEQNYLAEPDDDKALLQLGAGMHTLMDKTSPAHVGANGPKVWAGNFGSNIVFVGYHFWAELNLFHVSQHLVDDAVNNIRNYYKDAKGQKDDEPSGGGDPGPQPAPVPQPPAPSPSPGPSPVPTPPDPGFNPDTPKWDPGANP